MPEAVDAAVFADRTFGDARTRFAQAVQRPAAGAPTPKSRQVVLNAEEAAHAAIAAAIDVACRIGRSARSGPTS